MSTVTETTPKEEVEPACDTSLLDGEWDTKEAAVFPPGYPRLCSSPECFGECVPEGAWNKDGTAEWDHREEVDTLVRSSNNHKARRVHRMDG